MRWLWLWSRLDDIQHVTVDFRSCDELACSLQVYAAAAQASAHVCVCVYVRVCIQPYYEGISIQRQPRARMRSNNSCQRRQLLMPVKRTWAGILGSRTAWGSQKVGQLIAAPGITQLCLRGSRSNVHKYVSALQPCYQSASILRLYSAVCVGAIKSSGNQRRRLSKHFLIAVKRMWAEIWENSWAHEQIGVLKGTFLGKDCCSWDCATLRAWGRAVVEMFSCHVECLLLQSVFNHLCQCGGAFAPLEENRKLSREDGAK